MLPPGPRCERLKRQDGRGLKGQRHQAKPAQKPKRKQLSEAKLNALAKAREARWARIKGTARPAKPAQKPKKKFSAAARAALAAAARARWAKVKAAGKTRL